MSLYCKMVIIGEGGFVDCSWTGRDGVGEWLYWVGTGACFFLRGVWVWRGVFFFFFFFSSPRSFFGKYPL